MNIPLPVKIKTEDPLIVDLTEQEDVVGQWDANIQKQFIKGFVGDEYLLDKLMKEYIRSLREEAVNFKDYLDVKAKLLSHIKYFHLYQTELNCCFIEKYLENMEDILKEYCDLQVEILTDTRKKLGNKTKKLFNQIVNDVYKHIIYMFQVYLLNKEDHILNVLIKVNMNPFPKECNQLWTKIYIHYFKNKPMDLSDEAFCRAYIIYQRWKEFYPKKFHRLLNSTLFSRYERTEDSICESETLKRILMPKSDSTLDAISHISGQVYCMSNEYFKYIRSNRDIDTNINLTDDEDVNVPVLDCDEEDDVDFLNEYNNVLMNMTTLNDKVDESLEDDDDVQIISVALKDPPKTNKKQPIIIDLIDDDDDDEDTPVVVHEPAENQTLMMTTKFLDSIVIPDKPRKSYRKRTRTISAEKECSQEVSCPVPSVSPCPSTLSSCTTCLTITTKTKDYRSSAANNNKLVSPKSAGTNSASASNETTSKLNASNPNSSTCVYKYGLDTPPTLEDDKDHDPCTSKRIKEGDRRSEIIKENKDVYVTSYVHKGHGYYLKDDCLTSDTPTSDGEGRLSPPLEMEPEESIGLDDRQTSPKKVEPDILPNTKKKDDNMHNMDLANKDLLDDDENQPDNYNDESEDELLRSFDEDEGNFTSNIDIDEHELNISRPDNIKEKCSLSFCNADSEDVCFDQYTSDNKPKSSTVENCTEVNREKVYTSEINSAVPLNGAKQVNVTNIPPDTNRVSENVSKHVSENNNKIKNNPTTSPSNLRHTTEQQENQQVIKNTCIDEPLNPRNLSPTKPETKILHSQKSQLVNLPTASMSDFDEFQKSIWESGIVTNSSPSTEGQMHSDAMDSGPNSPTDFTSPSYECLDADHIKDDIRLEFTKEKFQPKNNGIAAKPPAKPLQSVLKKKDGPKKKKSSVNFHANEMDPIYSLLFDQSNIEDTKNITINGEPYQRLQLDRAILYEEFIKENKKESGQIMMMFNYVEGVLEVNDGDQGSYKYGQVKDNDGKRKRNMGGNSSRRDYEEDISKPKRKPRGKRKTILSG
ncbi:unnamed protein product [Brassicogethes aeneus]|uniref:Uncharacterized protein n=1 Tax=Brassicogethes aeneus TaxID=1431903 RepID=A0A9P0ASI7_BRAAE|nr:unnamed protein product [Brassicogethes aeneus]